MVILNKIYTRTGDDGTTGLVGGSRVPKDALRVIAYGEIDELNAHLGLAGAYAQRHKADLLSIYLSIIQNELFDIGAHLANPESTCEGVPPINTYHIARLEQWIDALLEGLPPLRSFVLPGGSLLNASLHIARTVCRRTERTLTTLARQEEVPGHLRIYMNRLSDLLFAMARSSSYLLKTREPLWIPGSTREELLRSDRKNPRSVRKNKRSTKKARPQRTKNRRR